VKKVFVIILDVMSGKGRKMEKWMQERMRELELIDINLAKMEGLSLEKYLQLAQNPFPFARIVLAHNSSISQEVIEILAQDSNPRVRDIAIERLDKKEFIPSIFLFRKSAVVRIYSLYLKWLV